jgi:hypothetical protein
MLNTVASIIFDFDHFFFTPGADPWYTCLCMKSTKLLDEIEQKLGELDALRTSIKEVLKVIDVNGSVDTEGYTACYIPTALLQDLNDLTD